MADAAAIPVVSSEEIVDFHQVLEALDSIILILDQNHQLRFANSPAEEFFGLSRSALLNDGLKRLLGAKSEIFVIAERAREHQGVVSQRNMPLQRGRDQEARVDARAVPLPGQPEHIVLSIQPLGFGEEVGRLMTGRDQGQGQSRGAADGPGDRESGMGAILAHEVKNPLAGIRGAAQLLARQIDASHEHLPQLIIDECDRINALIDRMELLGTRGLGSREPVNIHQILDQVIALEGPGAPEGFCFERQYDPSLPDLEGDPGLLVQCFQNLVRNGVEAAAGPKGLVRIGTSFQPGLRVHANADGPAMALPLEVMISDNGPGVDEIDRERIFQPFVSGRAGGGGTGLGLALVRRIISAHGGLVSCEPSADGAAFKIMFPIPAPPSAGQSGEGEKQ